MSWEYVEQKIRKALDMTRGNSTQARQQVIAWAMDDPKLLRELVKPHMVGITAHAVGRVISGKTKPETVPVPEDPDSKDTFGMDILKTIAGGDTAQFGQENYGRPVKKAGVSQSHIDAIQAMIDKSKK